jgi:hypothetical protein
VNINNGQFSSILRQKNSSSIQLNSGSGKYNTRLRKRSSKQGAYTIPFNILNDKISDGAESCSVTYLFFCARLKLEKNNYEDQLVGRIEEASNSKSRFSLLIKAYSNLLHVIQCQTCQRIYKFTVV